MRSVILGATCGLAACAVAVVWVVAGQSRNVSPEKWNGGAIRATLETTVPAHNDVSFRYMLENRTDSDYRVGDESEVTILGRSRSTGGLVAKAGEHVSGEFPLVVPARGRVHFALIWTADREIDPAQVGEFISQLDLASFVVLDNVRLYQIEFPARR